MDGSGCLSGNGGVDCSAVVDFTVVVDSVDDFAWLADVVLGVVDGLEVVVDGREGVVDGFLVDVSDSLVDVKASVVNWTAEESVVVLSSAELLVVVDVVAAGDGETVDVGG